VQPRFSFDGAPELVHIISESQPKRDGIFELGIPIHEITHGLTVRMTGGGTARCLQTTESGGLGEGWSDALAEYVPISHDWGSSN